MARLRKKRIIRWDNAPHWKDVDTYPHHKHENLNVFSSKEVCLDDILKCIDDIIQEKNDKI